MNELNSNDLRLDMTLEELKNIGAITFDTSSIEAMSFDFDNSVFKRIEMLYPTGIRTIYSEIIISEIRAHMKSNVNEYRETVKKKVHKLSKILALDSETVKNWLAQSDNFETNIDARINDFISKPGCEYLSLHDYAKSEQLFSLYFLNKPPFGNKNKKNEFPDAAALLSYEKWARENNTKILVISEDSDWKNYCKKSDYLICREKANIQRIINFLMGENPICADIWKEMRDNPDHTILTDLKQLIDKKISETTFEAETLTYTDYDVEITLSSPSLIKMPVMTDAVSLFCADFQPDVMKLTYNEAIQINFYAKFCYIAAGDHDYPDVNFLEENRLIEQKIWINVELAFKNTDMGWEYSGITAIDFDPMINVEVEELDFGYEDPHD